MRLPGIVVATPVLPIVIVPLVPVAVPTSIVKFPELPLVAFPVRMDKFCVLPEPLSIVLRAVRIPVPDMLKLPTC